MRVFIVSNGLFKFIFPELILMFTICFSLIVSKLRVRFGCTPTDTIFSTTINFLENITSS